MKTKVFLGLAILLAIAGIGAVSYAASPQPESQPPRHMEKEPISPLADDPSHPASPVKLIFIHHSCGGNWLANPNEEQPYGGLGLALMENNYFVSATNYGWGPDQIGSGTDIPNWPEWFNDTVMSQVYTEYAQNICNPTSPSEDCFGDWTRLATDPGGENQIIMFKSCYPNSDLYGQPTDEPDPGEIPTSDMTVRNAKAVYNHLLTYFAAHQDKLFIVIAAPPMADFGYGSGDQTPAERAANARAFNNWLVNNWLATYPHQNVAVFDYYNVLTSNGGDIDTNDYATRPSGNHHYWDGTQITHTQTVNNNFAAYPVDDGHPSTAGHQKATAEFVPLLNVFYNRWKGGTTCVGITDVSITGPDTGYTGTLYTFAAAFMPANASTPITYTWEPEPESGQSSASASYTWATTGTKTITVTAENCGGSGTDNHTITVQVKSTENYLVYVPMVLRNYGTVAPTCPYPLTGVTISGPSSGYTDTLYTFTANPAPTNATTPIAYTWSPAPNSGQGTASASYQWATTGGKTVSVAISNCSGAHTANDDHLITIQAVPSGALIQPGDLTYLGAFRLPDLAPEALYTMTWNYGGGALTYYPGGDDGGPSDGYPGSLFGAGHEMVQAIGEFNIPVPAISAGKNVNELNTADSLQDPYDVKSDVFPADTYWEIPQAGLTYLPLQGAQSTAKLYFSLANHAPGEHEDTGPTHGWCELDLGAPQAAGIWSIGGYSKYVTADYMFEIPQTWADAHVSGRYLATGRFRDGGQAAMGPSLIAAAPWEAGNPPISGTVLSATPLLLYDDVLASDPASLTNYHHSDEWSGAVWLTAGAKSAVIFVGTKGQGDCWYGCADGTDEPPWPPDCNRGWWSTSFVGQLLFYDPEDLAAVAQGTIEPSEPQPYATLDIDEYLYHIESTQQWHHLGAAAFDSDHGLLYISEPHADEDKPLVHVWQVQ